MRVTDPRPDLAEVLAGLRTTPVANLATVLHGTDYVQENCPKRLQKVVAEQATHLVQPGVIDPEELDTLVRNSLGLRWAMIGPFESQHLGGGPGGIRHLAAPVSSQMTFEMSSPDPQLPEAVFDAVEAVYGVGEDAYRSLARRTLRRAPPRRLPRRPPLVSTPAAVQKRLHRPAEPGRRTQFAGASGTMHT